jgi:magnesium chelatase family protein
VVPLQPLRADEIADAPPGESTEVLRERIDRARAIAKVRLAGTPWRTNAEIPAEDGAIERLCALDREAESLLRALSIKRRLSPRAQHRLRRVARTIADLGGVGVEAVITAEHVAQAASLRRLPDGRENG